MEKMVYQIKTDDISIKDMPKIAWIVIRKYGLKTFFFKLKNYVSLKLKRERINKNVYKNVPFEGSFRVLFVIGCHEGESKRYRVFNVAEYLKLSGKSFKIIQHSQIPDIFSELDYFDIVYFSRVAYDGRVEDLLKRAKERNIVTVFEVDDLVFDESVIDKIDGIKGWTSFQIEQYRQGVARYQKTLRMCDYFIGTTEFLVHWAKKNFDKEGFVLRNALNSIQISKSEEVFSKKKGEGEFVNIGYFSGSKTHQRDFGEVEDSLYRILERYPNVRFFLGGHLEIPEKFQKFLARIIRIPFTNWKELPRELSKIDINLAPLEIGNPFCESKSELKYTEAAILGIPTVASPTDAYKYAIQDGINGYLAKTSNDWYVKMEELVRNRDIRKKIGEQAKKDVEERYAPERMIKSVEQIFNDMVRQYREDVLKILPGKLVINWVIPEPSTGSGGHRNIFRAVKYLRKFGHYVRVYSLEGHYNFGDGGQLKSFVDSEFFETGADYYVGTENILPADAFIATHWSTVEPIWKEKEKAKNLFYFVQDYEPWFYPMGNEYIEAENTYKLGLNCITSGPWCAKVLKEKFNAKADFFKFPVDTDIYYERPYVNKEKKVVFFARPEMPRRCYDLGVKALEIFSKKNPDVEIVLYGSKNINSASIKFKHKNLGIIPTLDGIAELYSSGAVGMVFSTTNPSLVPYEMMACGLPVIDLDYNDNWMSYGDRETALLVDTLPEAIAEGIEKVLKNPELSARMKEQGNALVGGFPNEEEMARRVEELILKEF